MNNMESLASFREFLREHIQEIVMQTGISTYKELLAWEALWADKDLTEKAMAELFQQSPQLLPDAILHKYCEQTGKDYQAIIAFIEAQIEPRIKEFSVSIYGDYQYPKQLRDAQYPTELLYYIGDIDLTATKCIAVVGSREVSPLGEKRAYRVARELSESGFTIVSGLARGVDTNAHRGCLDANGRTIAVIGKPIDMYYPEENKPLQDRIKRDHLLLSHVPFLFHQLNEMSWDGRKENREFFKKRNVTMSALSLATVIVEAKERSGTWTQARACMQQKRKLFLMNNLFEDNNLTWPHTYEKQGAIRIRNTQDILENLQGIDDTETAELEGKRQYLFNQFREGLNDYYSVNNYYVKTNKRLGAWN